MEGITPYQNGKWKSIACCNRECNRIANAKLWHCSCNCQWRTCRLHAEWPQHAMRIDKNRNAPKKIAFGAQCPAPFLNGTRRSRGRPSRRKKIGKRPKRVRTIGESSCTDAMLGERAPIAPHGAVRANHERDPPMRAGSSTSAPSRAYAVLGERAPIAPRGIVGLNPRQEEPPKRRGTKRGLGESGGANRPTGPSPQLLAKLAARLPHLRTSAVD